MGTVGAAASAPLLAAAGGATGLFLTKNTAADGDTGYSAAVAGGAGPVYASGGWYDIRSIPGPLDGSAFLGISTSLAIYVPVYFPGPCSITAMAFGVVSQQNISSATLGVSQIAGATGMPGTLISSQAFAPGILTAGSFYTGTFTTAIPVAQGWGYLAINVSVAASALAAVLSSSMRMPPYGSRGPTSQLAASGGAATVTVAWTQSGAVTSNPTVTSAGTSAPALFYRTA